MFINCDGSSRSKNEQLSKNTFENKFVISFLGLRLRENPTLNGNIISFLPYGTEVEVIDESKDIFTINYLRGKWVKIKWKNYNGYVFDGYLYDKKNFTEYDKVLKFVIKRIDAFKKSPNRDYRSGFENWIFKDLNLFEKVEERNYSVYTFYEKILDNFNENCSYYGYSNCINVIIDKKGNIIFTDLDHSESMGNIKYYNDESIGFGYRLGEGHAGYKFYSETTYDYDIKKRIFTKIIESEKEICIEQLNENGSEDECKKWEKVISKEVLDSQGSRIEYSEKKF